MILTISIALTLLMTAALVSDLRFRRIPNGLTVAGIALGLGLRALPGDPALLAGVAGLGIAFAVTFPLFALGGFGGGDAKLMLAAGAFLGPKALLVALLLTGIVGGGLGLIEALRRGILIPVLLGAKDLLAFALTGGKSGERRTVESPGAVMVPYGAAIAVGALAAWFVPLMGPWLQR